MDLHRLSTDKLDTGRIPTVCGRLIDVDAGRLARVAKRHLGLFTRADAAACGFSRYQIRQRLESGEWRSVIGRVLVTAGVDLTPALTDRAAYLAVPGAVMAGPSAARSWGFPVSDRRTVVLLDDDRILRAPGVLILRGPLDPRDVGAVHGAQTTWRERTIFDCLRLMDQQSGVDLLDHALQQRWLGLDRLAELIFQNIGRRGVDQVRRLVRVVSGGERSEAERVLTNLLRRAGVIGWRANAPIFDDRGLIGLGDLVFEADKLVIEVDGWAYHVQADRFQRDRRRQNRLVRAGWRVLRFTWRDVTERPQYVIAAISAQVRVA
jgi:very-short-patch-repair endonuclease